MLASALPKSLDETSSELEGMAVPRNGDGKLCKLVTVSRASNLYGLSDVIAAADVPAEDATHLLGSFDSLWLSPRGAVCCRCDSDVSVLSN